MHGVVQIRAGSQPTTLIAEPSGTQASCSDQGGNGEPGLTNLSFLVRNSRTGDRVPVSLTTSETDDIDFGGDYVVTLRVGDVEERVAMTVRLVPKRRRHANKQRRRHRPRR